MRAGWRGSPGGRAPPGWFAAAINGAHYGRTLRWRIGGADPAGGGYSRQGAAGARSTWRVLTS